VETPHDPAEDPRLGQEAQGTRGSCWLLSSTR
jgi:hypothetical protein